MELRSFPVPLGRSAPSDVVSATGRITRPGVKTAGRDSGLDPNVRVWLSYTVRDADVIWRGNAHSWVDWISTGSTRFLTTPVWYVLTVSS